MLSFSLIQIRFFRGYLHYLLFRKQFYGFSVSVASVSRIISSLGAYNSTQLCGSLNRVPVWPDIFLRCYEAKA